jgi:5-hydroxyisourate hydrolase-like protein (transthyretin family)
MTSRPAYSIPQPCPQSWAAMTPTADGRHCAVCQTEVVDFTAMSDAEILAYLARQGSRPVCGRTHLAQLTPVPQWRRWLLAALALLGWQAQPAAAGPPDPTPLPRLEAESGAKPPKPGAQVIVRGQVFDDQNGQPAGGVRVLIKDTTYGTKTDEQGRFELVMAAGWEPLKSGKLTLHFEGSPFDFQQQDRTLAIRNHPKPFVLKVTMRSIARRGQVVGKMRMPEEPVKPPRE